MSGTSIPPCVHVKSLQSCPTFCDPMDCSPPDSSVHGTVPAKTPGVGCHDLLQGISSRRLRIEPESPCFLHWQTGSLPLAPPGKSSIPDIGFIYKDHGRTAALPPTTKYISVWK